MTAKPCKCEAHQAETYPYAFEVVRCPLHAAAPAMYEALVAALDHEHHVEGQCGCNWTGKARAALAAARGKHDA